MPKLRVCAFSVSIDGYGAGPDQSRENPLGLGGGVATIRQYLRAGLVDEMHLAISPVLLGRGEHLLHDLGLPQLGFGVREYVASARAVHVVLAKG